MSNITRLSRYAHVDHATAKERLIFTDRRSHWHGKPLLLPMVLLAIVLYFVVIPAFGATVRTNEHTCVHDWGVSKGGMAFTVVRCDGPLIEFKMFLTAERG